MNCFAVALCLFIGPLFSYGSYDLNDDILYTFDWNSEANVETHKPEPVIIKTTQNETFSCHLPSSVKDKRVVDPHDANLEPAALLAEFIQAYPCIYKVEGYWTYELCHGIHIRQFRAEGTGPKTTRVVKEYFLGLFQDQVGQIDDEEEETPGDSEPKSIQINGRDFTYHTVEYGNGTECDLTGVPRKASVLYVCLEESEGELFQISELETCVYQLIVFTRHLCASPRYNSHKVYSNPITCVPLDANAPTKPQALVALEKEKEDLVALGENEHLEGIFGALRVKGLKVEKLSEGGNVVYRVRTVDPLEDEQLSQAKGGAVTMGAGEVAEGVPAGVEEGNPKVVSEAHSAAEAARRRLALELRQQQRRELQSFLAGETCLTGGAGWWRYEVCYGGRITQYHEDPDSGERTQIILGKWNEAIHLAWVKESDLRKPNAMPDKRFKVTQFYDEGDFCEEAGAARNVRLSFVCHRKSSTIVQLSFSEPSICQYSISLESPLFCDLMKLADDNGLFPAEVTI